MIYNVRSDVLPPASVSSEGCSEIPAQKKECAGEVVAPASLRSPVPTLLCKPLLEARDASMGLAINGDNRILKRQSPIGGTSLCRAR